MQLRSCCASCAGIVLLIAIAVPLLMQCYSYLGQQQSYTLADVRQCSQSDNADSADFPIQGVRLGLPPENSSKNVVEANIDNMERQRLTELLTGFNVPPADGCTEEQLREMLKLVVRSDFWRLAWTKHSNKGLVRMWIYAHDGFRKRLAAMRQELDGKDELPANQLLALDKQFKEFVKKNEAHAEFEDNQLFPYFSENFPQYEEFWKELHQQHERYKQLVTDANQLLDPAASAAAAAGGGKSLSGDARNSLAAALLRFCEFYEAHMLLEERLLVPLWLNVSEQQKAELRARMHGMYWLSSYSF